MAYSLYKIINLTDTPNGKLVTAIPVHPIEGGEVNIGETYKFTCVRASTLSITSPTMLFSASFNYKDKF